LKVRFYGATATSRLEFVVSAFRVRRDKAALFQWV